MSQAELDAVSGVLCSPRLSHGPMVAAFEQAFARYLGRKYAVAAGSGTLGMMFALKAHGIGAGDEVITTAYSWRETAHAIALVGATPVFVDIDYWSGVMLAEKVAARVTPKTRAVLANNTNGHPAPWEPLRRLAQQYRLLLFEDSTEAIGSMYQSRLVGSFGDCSVSDFSQPAALCSGEGGVVVTDDAHIARAIRSHRSRQPAERSSLVHNACAPYQASMSELSAALGLVQLRRIGDILERRKTIERTYFELVKSFEGIKHPYVAPEVETAHWLVYLVHLGTRFSKSACEAVVEDLRRERIDAYVYCQPLHTQRYYIDLSSSNRRGRIPVTEKLADRAVALPFHCHLSEEQIAFIVSTMKDASVNVGAGAAIY
ncbi:MAG TPA: DegT/DnrJ/EryC1/StrS family aminotransferase [Xanthobacteraceae bacterium]|nr:DegT/DnrJ/EryC1/StrS family aminotransferase [Xanthobacteraceae bacterium]